MNLRTNNPVLARGFEIPAYAELEMGESSKTMTISGTIVKSAVLLALTMICGGLGWTLVQTTPSLALPICIGGGIAGLIIALILCFAPKASPYLAPLYAICKGAAVGALTFFITNMLVQNGKASSAFLVAGQALVLTFAIFGGLLAAYSFRIIRLSSTAIKVVTTLTLGVCFFSLIMFVLSIFNVGRELSFSIFSSQSGSLLGIGFSVFVVALAAFNLVMDFQFIEEGVEAGQPKYMEWYGAFGLLVTLIWLYIEVLRLLSKLRNR